ncbi:hypothetical protein BOX15_Mlig001829g3 [Macrostomum lignano]|uniref:Uncharacterized protein n=2 Tax=Macrostomum lignano TaxID=282301 RepID=A0A267FG35_9PLAT|nr:hypothetical protein BOX15_Mlig001829g1 [Macrostomum lignano]PAA79155.1 hypothetical protein BOX15_Mlig001829g3 [Macrostomum lignano]
MRFLINYHFWTPSFELEKKSVFLTVDNNCSTLELLSRVESATPFGRTPGHYNIGAMFYRSEAVNSMVDIPASRLFTTSPDQLNVLTYEIRTIALVGQ